MARNNGNLTPARHGFGLKSGVNEADTMGVTHTVRGTSSMGRMSGGQGNPKNNMVAANASRKRK